MAVEKSLLTALDADFNTAVRVGDKGKAVAVFSALVGIAIGVASAQSRPLYDMLNKATVVSLTQMTKDKNSVLHLITKNV